MITFTEEEVEILLNSRICEKPKTNADRIRSFSDEEMAEFLSKFDACDYCKKSVRDVCTVSDCDNIRKSELIKFLQSEVEV